ncbi:hypothetical protein [Actinomadura miaoliensis]|uniref:Uncharacterized protein n=1 Tax=Actinomadura miaoliensis TaxID=430685 RepID=A0ABP7W6X5_9ACTN
MKPTDREPRDGVEVCPDCGQDIIRRYRVRATGEQFWLCEECDAVWRAGADRSVADFFYLSDFLPAEPDPWKVIERAEGTQQPGPLQALVDLAAKGELSGLALGMHRADALTVVGVPPDPAPIGVVEAGDVSLTFEADTLVGVSVRFPPTGVRWPGLMPASTAPRLTPVPRPEALAALRDAGVESLSATWPDDRAAEFWIDGRRVRLEFDQGLLSAVGVSRASN